MNRRARLAPIALLLVTGWLSSCSLGTRLVYQNLDTLVQLQIDDYVDLEPAQDQLLRQEFETISAWHRREELPAYAKTLLSTADTVEGSSLDRAAVDHIADTFLDAMARLSDYSAPGLAKLLSSLTDEQVSELLASQQQEVDDALEEYEDETPPETLKRLTSQFEDRLENWIGKLTPEQNLLLAKRMTEAATRGAFAPARFKADRAEDLRRFAGLLATRREPGFTARLQAFVLPQDKAAQAERMIRRERGRIFFTALAITLTPQQRASFVKRLRRYADDATALAAKTLPLSMASSP